MGKQKTVENNFNQLSLKDLIEARDHFHVHLQHKANVVATALGKYRVRKKDHWPSARHSAQKPKHHRGKKTLDNTEVRSYSWPCILVFVAQWIELSDFANQPSEMIEPAVYMPDGRVVPVCVIEAPLQEEAPPPIALQNLAFPYKLVGGGYPVVTEVQGETRVGSFGCLVTDGHTTYAMTNRHVAGPPGQPVSTILAGTQASIGTSTEHQLSHRPFADVYGMYPGRDAVSTLDVALVEIDDVHHWTAQVFGIGTLGPMADLSIDNISLRLIGCPVRAHGAASGDMEAEIVALFYRYKSVGGFDYIADFAFGPRSKPNIPFRTRPGDSGTTWLLEKSDDTGTTQMLPLALQWGGQAMTADGTPIALALGTCLATACRLLDVDVIRDWNIGHPEYWGAVGHYTIAAHASQWIKDAKLRTLMEKHLEVISFRDEDISAKSFKSDKKRRIAALSNRDYVPLADVPDLIWKNKSKDDGGRGHGYEGPNHFADIDKPNKSNQTLLDLCDSPDKLTSQLFADYYSEVAPDQKPNDWGCLPFRVWQYFDAMTKFAAADDAKRFIAAAGTLAHYVGDACQPLHCSYLHHGDPADAEKRLVRDRNSGKKVEKMVPRGDGVHSAYEDGMVDTHTPDLITRIDKKVTRSGVEDRLDDKPKAGELRPLPLVTSGQEAGYAMIQLMRRTFQLLPPKDICDSFLHELDGGAKPREISDALWDEYGNNTAIAMADGARTLAMLWEASWSAGRKRKSQFTHSGPFHENDMRELYLADELVPSLPFPKLVKLLKA